MSVTSLGSWPGVWTPAFPSQCLAQHKGSSWILSLAKFAGSAIHQGCGGVFPSGDMTATRQ